MPTLPPLKVRLDPACAREGMDDAPVKLYAEERILSCGTMATGLAHVVASPTIISMCASIPAQLIAFQVASLVSPKVARTTPADTVIVVQRLCHTTVGPLLPS